MPSTLPGREPFLTLAQAKRIQADLAEYATLFQSINELTQAAFDSGCLDRIELASPFRVSTQLEMIDCLQEEAELAIQQADLSLSSVQ